MQTIWKFPLHLQQAQAVLMPQVRTILKVAVQDDVIRLWAIVDPESPKEMVDVLIVGTGHDIRESPGRYLDTVLIGSFVWHVFVRDNSARCLLE